MADKKEIRNILSLWLGNFLSEKRTVYDVTTTELKNKLDISLPYLRMVENGLTNVAPSKSFNLMKGLEVLRVYSNFSSISNYLVSCQYLSGSKEIGEAKRRIQNLSDTNGSIGKLLLNLSDEVWNLLEEGNYNELKKLLAKEHFMFELEDFLANPQYGLFDLNEREKSRWSALYAQAPSVHNDFLENSYNYLKNEIERLEKISPYYNLIKWEEDNHENFEKIYGFLTHWVLIEKYADKFNWNYVVKGNFKLSSLYILEKSSVKVFQKKANDVKRLIIKNSDLYSNNIDEAKIFMDKFEIKQLDVYSKEKLLKNLKWDAKRLSECWIYELRNQVAPKSLMFNGSEIISEIKDKIAQSKKNKKKFEELSDKEILELQLDRLDTHLFRYKGVTNEIINNIYGFIK